MIPTIEDIVRGVKDGSIGFNQACRWLEDHVKLAREAGGADAEERRYFAAMAMQGLMGSLATDPACASELAVQHADCLLARLATTPPPKGGSESSSPPSESDS